MPNIIAGFVKNGVVVPNAPLPEGAFVEVHLIHGPVESPSQLQEEPDARNCASAQALELGERLAREGEDTATQVSPSKLRKMPREQRQAILEAAANRAEQDYRTDKELTGFDAFSEEERNDDESDMAHVVKPPVGQCV
jgi:hypothetical protein